MTTADAIRRHTIDARSALIESLQSLGTAAWSLPTPCEGWTTRDVLAHLVAWDALLVHPGGTGVAGAGLRWVAAMTSAWFDPNRLNRKFVEADNRSGPELLDQFRIQLPAKPHWLFERVAPGAQLAEYVIHHYDLSVAIGVTHDTPPDHVRIALEGVARVPGLHTRRLLASNLWTAIDVDWSAGRGTPVQAEGIAILLALAGRGPEHR